MVAEDSANVWITMLSIYNPSSFEVCPLNCNLISSVLLPERRIAFVEKVVKLDNETAHPDADSVPEEGVDLDGSVVKAPQSPSPSNPRSIPAGVFDEDPGID